MSDITLRLGSDAGPQSFTDQGPLVRHCLSMLEQTRRRVRIFTHDLEPALYDHSTVIDALSVLARRSRYSVIEVLVFDPRRAISEGHRLIDLAQRLSDVLSVRQVHPDYQHEAQSFALFDERGLIYRPLYSEPDGYADYNAPSHCIEKQLLFQGIWDKSAAIAEFRRIIV